MRLFCFKLRRMHLRIISALFYGIVSILIMIINKLILSTYKFPSPILLAIGQMSVTILAMELGRRLRFIEFAPWSLEIPFQIFPLPVFYLGNLIFGLIGTGAISLPMFTVLRRFSNLFILIAEAIVLKEKVHMSILASILVMIAGAGVAALHDLSFDGLGYFYIFLNNICTMGYGVSLKMKLTMDQLNKYALLYYNAVFMFIPALMIGTTVGDVQKGVFYPRWNDPYFIALFSLSTVLGVLLLYSAALCTQHNSALTTSVIGVIKNISITYIGMFVGGDYMFTYANFLGLNVSALGAIFYSYVTFRKPPPVVKKEGEEMNKVVTAS